MPALLELARRLEDSEPFCLISQEPFEPRANMRLGHVDVVLLSNSW